MKVFLIIFLISLPIVYAQVTFFKESYSPGETVQLELNLYLDVLSSVKSSQVSILKPNNEVIITQVTLLEIAKNHYLIYFDLPVTTPGGRYLLTIKNIMYRENGVLKLKDINVNFDVRYHDYNVIRLLPGAAIYSEGERVFSKFKISNLGDDVLSFRLPRTNVLMPSINLLTIPGRSVKTFYILISPKNIQNSTLEIYGFENYLIPFYLKKVVRCIPRWQCENWFGCVDNVQVRKCVDLNDCDKDCESEECVTERECQTCIPNWQCNNYSLCRQGRRYCNSVVDINNCSIIYNGDYYEFNSIACNVCIPRWQCENWFGCVDNVQVRKCVDLNDCDKDCESEECVTERACRRGSVCIINNICEAALGENITNCPRDCFKQNVSELNLEYSIAFFNDINKPEETINSLVNPNLNEKKELRGILYIKNTGNAKLTKIKFDLTGNLKEIVNISLKRKDEISPGEIASQLISVNEKKMPGNDEYRGELVFTSDQLNQSFSMIFVISKEKIDEARLIDESDLLFSEEIAPLQEKESVNVSKNVGETKTIVKKETPYKVIVTILLIILIAIIYLISKRVTKRKISFNEYLSKIEKK